MTCVFGFLAEIGGVKMNGKEGVNLERNEILVNDLFK